MAGNALDDLVLRSRTDTAETGIDFQIKRTASPTAADGAFIDVLHQCLDTMRQQSVALAEGRLQLGFAASGPRGPLEQLKRLTDLARSHATAETFLGVLVPGAVARDVRDRQKHVQDAVSKVLTARGESLGEAETEELTFELLKFLRVWIFEVGDDGRDVLEAQSRLATMLPAGGPGVHAVFSELRTLAETWGPSAGVIEAPMVRAALFARQIPLTADPRHRADLDRVLKASRQELAHTVDRMGGKLRLERVAAAEELVEAIGEGIVLVSGAAGVGKSVLARRAVKRLGDDATVVAVDLTTRSGDTLATIQQEFGVTHLETVLAAAPTTSPRILLIDGAEHALTDSGRLLESLLRAAPTGGSSSPPWMVVITCRTDAAGPLTEHLGNRLSTHIKLDELSDAEVAEVSIAFPTLAPLVRHPRSKRLLRRPFLVDLMVRSHTEPAEGDALGEEDILAVVHDKVVRRSEGLTPGHGSPHDRGVVWSTLAEAVIEGKGNSRLSLMNGAAVSGLVSDDILRRKSSTYRFAHDVLADYATAMRLTDDDGAALLTAASNARSLIRAVRLASQRKLADADGDPAEIRRVWAEILESCRDLAGRDGSRWTEVPFEALVSMGSPDGVLAALTSRLLADDGAALGTLIGITGRYATTSRYEPDGAQLLIDDVLAAPVVALVGVLADRVPERLTGAATRLIHRWLVSVELNGHRVAAFIANPTRLSASVARWAGEDRYGDRYESALAAVGLLGKHLSEEGRILMDRADGQDLDAVAEDPQAASALARDSPDLLLELAGRYYLDLPLTLDPDVPERRPARQGRRRRRRELSGYEEEEGVRDHSSRTSFRMNFGLAGPDWGPFATLLANSPRHGLRLVGEVVDAATAARIRVEQSFNEPSEVVLLRLKLPHWAESITYDGPATAWAWYRKSGNGAWVAMSALLALRGWAKAETASRPLPDVLDDVLGAGASVAFPAVAYSLLVSDLAAAGNYIDAFLEHPDVWDLEIGRVVIETSFSQPSEDEAALRVTPDRVAAWLALTADTKRQAALNTVGERLLVAAREVLGDPPDDDPRLSVPRRRALALDAAAYQSTPSREQPGAVEISLDVPADVQEELERGGGRAATLSLTLNHVMFSAMKIRDGQANDRSAAQIYAHTMKTLQSIAETPGAYSIHTADDARAIAAAAVATQAATGDDDDRALLPEAVRVLVQIANTSTAKPETYLSERDTSWDMGADRSAATALPTVLLNQDLLAASGAAHSDVATALKRLAGRKAREVRHRLTRALEPTWMQSCQDNKSHTANHATALTVYRELLLDAGIGPRSGQKRLQVRLTEPFEAALDEPAASIDLRMAADALPGLKTAAGCDCEHATEGRAMLAALVTHDLRAWPAAWGRHRDSSSGAWRQQMDAWVATEILSGDGGLLERYVNNFAKMPEQLTGLIAALSEHATSPEMGRQLFMIWPTILDRLLPAARHVPGPGESRPRTRQEADLDKALLPKPSDLSVWPGREWMRTMVRWVDAYAPRPKLCDRLIVCLAPTGLTFTPTGTQMILRMLGNNPARIPRDSQYIAAWLRLALLEQQENLEAQQPALRQLVDDLSALGSTEAVLIQRELEA
ncbi:ATP-binding protein [Couchioplanes caeruleus]|uniref:ATP-binding protein n=1 Tax=Couchioplanes caeruleus TaxID=56438 RepID=UPI0020BF8C0A|nr:ATP-binding protein [Couchioplanes caeruleus]UQU67528.1 ATP-binding protein [Couchioplanes caeruleus]